MVEIFTAWKAEVLPVVLGQAYDLNCSSEIFDSKWPWCVQLIYTRSHKSLPSLWFSTVTQMLYSAQGFCCEKRKIPQKCTVSEAEMSQAWSCSHHEPGQQLLHKPRIRPSAEGASERAEPFFPEASPPLTVPGSNKQRGLVLCLDFVSHYPTLHSEQMWGSFSLFGTLLHPDQIENTAQHQKTAQIHQSAIWSYPLTYWFNLGVIPDLLLGNPGLNSQLRHPFLA